MTAGQLPLLLHEEGLVQGVAAAQEVPAEVQELSAEPVLLQVSVPEQMPLPQDVTALGVQALGVQTPLIQTPPGREYSWDHQSPLGTSASAGAYSRTCT